MLRYSYAIILIIAALVSGTHATAAEKSQVIYQRLCAQCHGKDGGGLASIAAPTIAGMQEWYVERQLHHFREGIRGTHPYDVAGTRMAPMARFLRTKEDLVAVAKYVAALKPVKQPRTVEGNVVRGEKQFQVCAACHGNAAEGNEATNAPRLAGLNDWYLLTQLKNFKHSARGGDPTRDPIAYVMVANASLLDDQAMLDIVAYINTLDKN